MYFGLGGLTAVKLITEFLIRKVNRGALGLWQRAVDETHHGHEGAIGMVRKVFLKKRHIGAKRAFE
jgi:hypothetical protein